MRKQKMGLDNMQGQLSGAEMKKIYAGIVLECEAQCADGLWIWAHTCALAASNCEPRGGLTSCSCS